VRQKGTPAPKLSVVDIRMHRTFGMERLPPSRDLAQCLSEGVPQTMQLLNQVTLASGRRTVWKPGRPALWSIHVVAQVRHRFQDDPAIANAPTGEDKVTFTHCLAAAFSIAQKTSNDYELPPYLATSGWGKSVRDQSLKKKLRALVKSTPMATANWIQDDALIELSRVALCPFLDVRADKTNDMEARKWRKAELARMLHALVTEPALTRVTAPTRAAKGKGKGKGKSKS